MLDKIFITLFRFRFSFCQSITQLSLTWWEKKVWHDTSKLKELYPSIFYHCYSQGCWSLSQLSLGKGGVWKFQFWLKKKKISSCKAHWSMLWVLQRVMVVVAVRQLEWKTSTWQLSSKCSIKQDYYVPLVVIAAKKMFLIKIKSCTLSNKNLAYHVMQYKINIMILINYSVKRLTTFYCLFY